MSYINELNEKLEKYDLKVLDTNYFDSNYKLLSIKEYDKFKTELFEFDYYTPSAINKDFININDYKSGLVLPHKSVLEKLEENEDDLNCLVKFMDYIDSSDDEKYKDFNVSYRGDITEIDFNNDDFNRKLILHDGWDGWDNVEYKLVLEQYGDADIDVNNKCIGEIYSNELYQNSKEGKLGTYYVLENHSDEQNLYNLYYLSDQRSYVNISRYIDDLIDDMDNISDMKDVVAKHKENEFVEILNNLNKVEQEDGLEL